MGTSVSDKLKDYIIKNGGDPTGANTVAELVDKLPSGGGSGGGLFKITANLDEEEEHDFWRLDKTWNEIEAAYTNGMLPVLVSNTDEVVGQDIESFTSLASIGTNDQGYVVGFMDPNSYGQVIMYTTNDPYKYPTHT